MSKEIPFVMQGSNITLVINNQSHTVSADSHRNFFKILEALKMEDWASIPDLVDTTKALTNYGKGKLSIIDGEMFWDKRPFHNSLSKRLIAMHEGGFSIEPMMRFTENLMENPSYRAVEELFGFLENNELPLTPDGHFLAYKKVKVSSCGTKLLDIYTGKIDNSVGQDIEVPRNEVDDDPQKTCSKGLHVCSEEYLRHYGGSYDPIVMVKVHPRDVVSVPYDYNHSKMRVCRYSVIGIHGDKNNEGWDFINRFTSAPVQDFEDDTWEDDTWEDDSDGDDSLDNDQDLGDNGYSDMFKPI